MPNLILYHEYELSTLMAVIDSYESWVGRQLRYRAMIPPTELLNLYLISHLAPQHVTTPNEVIENAIVRYDADNEGSCDHQALGSFTEAQFDSSSTSERLQGEFNIWEGIADLIDKAFYHHSWDPMVKSPELELCLRNSGPVNVGCITCFPVELQLAIIEALPIWHADELVRALYPHLAQLWLGTLESRLLSFFDQLCSPENLRYLGCSGSQKDRKVIYRPSSFNLHPNLAMDSASFTWIPHSQHAYYGPPHISPAVKLNIIATLESLTNSYANVDVWDIVTDHSFREKVVNRNGPLTAVSWFAIDSCDGCVEALDRATSLPVVVPLCVDRDDIEVELDLGWLGALEDLVDHFALDEADEEYIRAAERQPTPFLVLLPDEFYEIRKNMLLFMRSTIYHGGGVSTHPRNHRFDSQVGSSELAFLLKEDGQLWMPCSHGPERSELEEFLESVERIEVRAAKAAANLARMRATAERRPNAPSRSKKSKAKRSRRQCYSKPKS